MALIDWNENGKSPHILRRYAGFGVPYYTIPSNNRELRLIWISSLYVLYYTIPSNNRELRRVVLLHAPFTIIPYQVITGNYDSKSDSAYVVRIIPYQVITGNYDFSQSVVSKIKTAHGESNLIRLLSPWAVSQKNIYYS